jgi:DNA-binding NtrC family response regulator
MRPAEEIYTTAVNAFIRRPLAEIERDAVILAACECRSMSEAAERLGIDRRTLYRKLEEYGLQRKRVVTVETVVEPKIGGQP